MSNLTIAAALPRGAGPGRPSWPTALARPIRRGIGWIGHRRKLRRHADALMALDDHLLTDIGLRRGHIAFLAEYADVPGVERHG